ncbi:ion channel [Acidiferrobacter sp.]|uniref:ion channel n=1 Tax=Acidiferrobacter sp. TaxID=1872107 RepID=UPI002639BBAC|nr:ion channel [Acidiferrobacter sp.]
MPHRPSAPQPPPRPLRTLWRDRVPGLLGDLYHALLTMGWPRFVLGVGLLFLIVNALFAFAYWVQPAAIVHARPGSFLDAFFFSVQTMATIGYGVMYPGTLYANILMTLESLVGLFGLAFATGLAYARFSRPRARIVFTRHAVISTYYGVPTLMFRAANKRGNQILEARVEATLLRNEVSPEGHAMRRFYDLPLLRKRNPTFSYTWMIMHPITKESPLHGYDPEQMRVTDTQIVVILSGLDETLSQGIHARHIYRPEDLLPQHRLEDVLSKRDGTYVVDYSRFDNVVPDSGADTHPPP